MTRRYEQLYPGVFAAIRVELQNAGRIHGSKIRDFLGWRADSGLVESIIDEFSLYPESEGPDPTPSQKAFFSLQRSKQHPGFAPGTKEHFWLTPSALKSVAVVACSEEPIEVRRQRRAAECYECARNAYERGDFGGCYLLQHNAAEIWKGL